MWKGSMPNFVTMEEATGHIFVVDGDGSVRLPASCELLKELYKKSGVRIRMVSKPFVMTKKKRQVTVRQLMDELTVKHRQNRMLCIQGSSGTPTAAFSSSDLLYGTDGLPRPPPGDDLAGSDISGYERDRQRLRDLEIGNKRPPSKGKRGSYSLVDKVSFDREREEGRVLNNSLPAKPPTFRSNGIRSSLVRGEQLLTQRNSNPNTGRESDDLIAMGTLWSPANNNNNNSGGSSGPTTRSSTTASNKSAALVCQNGSSNNNNNSNNNSNGSSQRKPISMSTGKLSHSSSFNGLSTNTFGRQLSTNNNNTREDPKYPDPLQGAPASFQQRLMELASLEAETIRWERTKRVKKKPRQDRDS